MSKIELPPERKKTLRAVARLMNKQGHNALPVNTSMLEFFDLVITTEEAEFLLKMGQPPRTYQQITDLMNLPEKESAAFFEQVTRKGLVQPIYSEGEARLFAVAPVMPGWIEIYFMNRKDSPEIREFIHRFDEYFKSFKKFNFFPLRNIVNVAGKYVAKAPTDVVIPSPAATTADKNTQSTRIDIQEEAEVSSTSVYPPHSVIDLIEKHGEKNRIAVVDCMCRKWRKVVDETCQFDHPEESCIVLGDWTAFWIDYGTARHISKDEALAIIKEVQKKGAVHQVFFEFIKRAGSERTEAAICNCCWDCCGSLGTYNRGLIPLPIKSYYQARITNASDCIGCDLCVSHCPVEAVTVQDKTPKIEDTRCIGCGQCQLQCPNDVFTLQYKERDVFLPLMKKSKARIPVRDNYAVTMKGSG